MTFADQGRLSKEGRSFNCETCPAATKAARRCAEDRWDFTSKDGPSFPVYIHKGGELYGFCPAKASWDQSNVQILRLLMIAAETGAMLKSGGLEDQPTWFIELLGWFIPRLDYAKFGLKVASVMGDGSKKDAAKGLLGKVEVKGGGNNR